MRTKRIPVDELRFGMYIAELDRPWAETPFMFQGFVLTTQKQLEGLRKYCTTVLIDPERSDTAAAPGAARPVYAERASVEQEMAPAHAAYGSSRALMHDVLAA